MKLITAIVNKEDSKNVCNELIKAKFYVTRLATTGGFLMAGNMTLLIGTEDERVDDCIKVISRCCKQRTEIVPGTASNVLRSSGGYIHESATNTMSWTASNDYGSSGSNGQYVDADVITANYRQK